MNLRNKNINGIFNTVSPTSIYPSTYLGFPEDQDDWVCNQWKTYYLRNKDIAGKDYAKEVLYIDSERVGMWANLGNCAYDCEFVTFFKKELGSDFHFLSDIYCGFDDIADTGSNIARGSMQISKVVVPLAVLGAGAFIFANFDKIKKNIKLK